jgi:DNA-binding transcriptional LysR family regulator
LEDLRAVEQEMASRDAEPRGRLRVSASLLLGQTRVVPILVAFLKKTPAVSLELELTDRVVDMVAERVDVAVRITSEPPASFVARRVGSMRRVLCASPTYLRMRRAPRTPSDLAEHACLLLSGPGSSTVWDFAPKVAGGAPESVRVAARLRASNTITLYEAAKAGLGIAELPRHLVEQDLRARRLVALLEPFARTEPGVYVVYIAGPLLPVRVREVVSHLVRELEKVLR